MILEMTRPVVFFDLETTGLDTASDRIVEIGLVRVDPDGKREQMVERVDPGVDIPDAAARVHGIRTEEVRGLFGRPTLAKVQDKILSFLGDADLGGFNSMKFDLPLWLSECERHGIPFRSEGRLMVDAKVIFNCMEGNWDRFLMGPRTLSAAVRHYCGRDLDGAHSAGVDADATVDVLLAQLVRYEQLPRTVAGLHEYCQEMSQRIDAPAEVKGA